MAELFFIFHSSGSKVSSFQPTMAFQFIYRQLIFSTYINQHFIWIIVLIHGLIEACQLDALHIDLQRSFL